MLDDEEPDWDESEWEGDDDDLESETIACPNCGNQIYEEAEICPVCDEYVTSGGQSGGLTTSQPVWVVVTACVLLAMFLFWILQPLW